MHPWPCNCKNRKNLPCGYHDAEHEYSDSCKCGHTLECCRAYHDHERSVKDAEIISLTEKIEKLDFYLEECPKQRKETDEGFTQKEAYYWYAQTDKWRNKFGELSGKIKQLLSLLSESTGRDDPSSCSYIEAPYKEYNKIRTEIERLLE